MNLETEARLKRALRSRRLNRCNVFGLMPNRRAAQLSVSPAATADRANSTVTCRSPAWHQQAGRSKATAVIDFVEVAGTETLDLLNGIW